MAPPVLTSLQKQLQRFREQHAIVDKTSLGTDFTFQQIEAASQQPSSGDTAASALAATQKQKAKAKEYHAELQHHALELFEELRRLDPEFAPFEHLFVGKPTNRQFLTKFEIEKRDAELTRFGLLLSPFFDSTRLAEAALEFLISRYEMNVYHVGALMACVLPFHETEQFGR